MPPEFMTPFQVFYAGYPRKQARKDAEKAWNQLNPDTALAQLMIDQVEVQKRSAQWQRGFIPLAATWIRGERWNDQLPLAKAQRVPTGTTKQQDALARINTLVAQGMDRRQAILQVENQLWPSPDPHVH